MTLPTPKRRPRSPIAAAARRPPAVASLDWEYSRRDYRGRLYSDFYPRRAPSSGPGWFVFGRSPEYGNTLIRLCARPAVEPRAHPHYNVMVRRGWRTRRAAQAAADLLNRRFPNLDAREPAGSQSAPPPRLDCREGRCPLAAFRRGASS